MNNKGIMTNNLKMAIAKELGIYETIQQHGWGVISSRNCGNLVKIAIEKANQNFQ